MCGTRNWGNPTLAIAGCPWGQKRNVTDFCPHAMRDVAA
jgi:hypothetical protein